MSSTPTDVTKYPPDSEISKVAVHIKYKNDINITPIIVI